ncbi:MAG: LysM peptidoglycan-binding domain-containing protein [Aquiluna sp.]
MNVGTYRLTNPRRFARAISVVALAVALSVLGVSNSMATNSASAELIYVTVAQGDSLWNLGERHATGDVRDWIAEVVILNGLQSSELTPGQQIALP